MDLALGVNVSVAQEEKDLRAYCLAKDYVTCAKLNARRQAQGRLPKSDLNTQVFFLMSVTPEQVDEELEQALISILTVPNLDVSRLANLVVAVLIRELKGVTLSVACQNSLLNIALERVLCGSVAMERILSSLRRDLLLSLCTNGQLSDDESALASALVFQVILNEYVWVTSELEDNLLSNIEQLLTMARANAAWRPSNSPALILVFSLYQPLTKIWARFSFSEFEKNQWPLLLRRQLELTVVAEKREAELKKSMPSLLTTETDVSSKVRAQYEENPYPRWQNLLIDESCSVDTFLSKKLPDVELSFFNKNRVEVLVAGCGTGAHPLALASQMKNSFVSAIDLSLSSLAYAKRMAEKLDISNVEFIQVDILELGSIDRQFDIISCGGVLHHLNHPLDGWRVITLMLAKGGAMNIALYSAIARTDVRRQRALIREAGLQGNDHDIKNYRQVMMARDPNSMLLRYRDFWSTSECRDLLFHECEHHYSWLGIKETLAQLGLRLAYVDVPQDVREQFLIEYPSEGADVDCTLWYEYETKHPSTFRSMYNFWCIKA